VSCLISATRPLRMNRYWWDFTQWKYKICGYAWRRI